MGVSSVRSRALASAFFIACPFDTKIITAGVGIPHVDVRYIAILEQILELGFDGAIGNILLRDQSPAIRIGVEGQTVGKHVHRKASVLRISVATVLMDENGTRQRKFFLFVKRIVGEKYPAIAADDKGLQALPARPVTGGHLCMRRMTITW
jgi:hypothetical protein